MKRVLVTLVSVGLIAGLTALIPLLSGGPASAAAPCQAQHRAATHAQKVVKRDRARLTKDRRHHRHAAVKKDKRRLAAAQRRLRTARSHVQLCQARHKPAKTVTVSPSPGAPGIGLPSGLASYFPSGVPSGIASQLPSLFPSGVPTDPGAVCSILESIPIPIGSPICP